MPKFDVYAVYTGSKHLGTFEAETEEEAIAKAEEEADCMVNLCHHCSDEIEVGDCTEFQASKAE